MRTLVLGVLRWRSRLDFVIAELAKRADQDSSMPPVVEVLRLGLYQLLYMDVRAVRGGVRDGRSRAEARARIRQRDPAQRHARRSRRSRRIWRRAPRIRSG